MNPEPDSQEKDRPQVLYRVFNSADELLYVGITLNIATRFSAHSADKPWWGDAATIRLEHFADRRAVMRAERDAIITEKPAHNIVWRRSPMVDYGLPDDYDDARFQVLSMISFTQDDVLESLNRCRDEEHRASIVKEAIERLRGFIEALPQRPGE